MPCTRCGHKDATIVVKQLVNNAVREQKRCADCAHSLKGSAGPTGAPLLSLLSALGLQQSPATRRRLECTSCGLVYSEFRKNGLLGCADCYRSFAKPIAEILEEIHGSTRHTGKRPPENPKAEIRRLKKELEAAIANETFEEAAHLRDRIQELECS